VYTDREEDKKRFDSKRMNVNVGRSGAGTHMARNAANKTVLREWPRRVKGP